MRFAHFSHTLQLFARRSRANCMSERAKMPRIRHTFTGRGFSSLPKLLAATWEERGKRAGGACRPPVLLFFPFEVGRFCEQRANVSPWKREEQAGRAPEKEGMTHSFALASQVAASNFGR